MNRAGWKTLDLIPRYILGDPNGYAIAKAIEWAVDQWLEAVDRAEDNLTNPDAMEEWALDEYARGYGMTWYDYSAGIEKKRKWVKDADFMRNAIGTKAAILRLLEAEYARCDVEEWFDYEGEPYHFRVTVEGETGGELEAWARKSIYHVKNIRSLFDDLAYGHKEMILVEEKSTAELILYRQAGDLLCGTYPEWVYP